ncbi:MAG: hypothetical protein AAF961_17725, partial [Planctomycetota bacterium]
DTKYLNFAELDTGFIVTPFEGPSVAQSIQFTTANDAVPRDPTSFQLYGTNDPIMSVDNGDGLGEAWTLIFEDSLTLTDDRLTLGDAISFANSTSYASYKVQFPTVKDAAAANSMQIADVDLFESNDGSGLSIWTGDDAIAFAPTNLVVDSGSPAAEQAPNLLDGGGANEPIEGRSESSYPDGEPPANAIDQTLAKYFNGGGTNSGFIVTPTSGPSQVQSFQLTTANDADTRDPNSWALYGTNEAIVSLDNSTGEAEAWTLIDQGDVELPLDRDTPGPVIEVSNGDSYSSYKLLFPNLFDEEGPMQIAEAAFYQSTDGTGDNVVGLGDPILAVDADPLFGSATKYLNFGEENSGFIITPASGSSVVDEFQMTTANDAPERDPTSWELYGTNDPITSEEHSQGDAE